MTVMINYRYNVLPGWTVDCVVPKVTKKFSKWKQAHVGMEPTKVDGNDTTTLSHHPYFLCHFAATYTIMVCMFLIKYYCEQRVVEGSVGVVLGAHVDVHGEWVMLWVPAMYNVHEHDRCGLSWLVCRNCWVHAWAVLGQYGMCGTYMVCMVRSYVGVYVMLWNFIAAQHGRYGSMEDCGVSNPEYLVHLVHMNRLSAYREFCGVHSWQRDWHKM